MPGSPRPTVTWTSGKAYATAVLDVLEERDSLRDSLSRRERLVPIPMPR